MTITSEPWKHPRPEQSQLRLDVVPARVVHALASGETASLGVEYASSYLADADCGALWRMRSKQLIDTPRDAPWITRSMVDPLVAFPVGVAGFHGAPDETGMVEIGYRVAPDLRRRGYARRSVETLLHVARGQLDVKTVRATISPDNLPSLALIRSFGFVESGEQWDEEDGLEIIFEISSSEAHLGCD